MVSQAPGNARVAEIGKFEIQDFKLIAASLILGLRGSVSHDRSRRRFGNRQRTVIGPAVFSEQPPKITWRFWGRWAVWLVPLVGLPFMALGKARQGPCIPDNAPLKLRQEAGAKLPASAFYDEQVKPVESGILQAPVAGTHLTQADPGALDKNRWAFLSSSKTTECLP